MHNFIHAFVTFALHVGFDISHRALRVASALWMQDGFVCWFNVVSLPFWMPDSRHILVQSTMVVSDNAMSPDTRDLPSISHYDAQRQYDIIMLNARTARLGGESVAFLTSFECDEIDQFLRTAMDDSNANVNNGRQAWWPKAFQAVYHALIRCLRLRYAGEPYDIMVILTSILHYCERFNT